MALNQSILTSVKKTLNLAEDFVAFDPDVLMHINTAFSTLNQLGVGPDLGLQVEDKTATWDALLGTDPRYNMVKTYVGLRVREVFDPPTTSFGLQAIKEQIKELEWRISTYREMTGWTDPDPPTPPVDEDIYIDGEGP